MYRQVQIICISAILNHCSMSNYETGYEFFSDPKLPEEGVLAVPLTEQRRPDGTTSDFQCGPACADMVRRFYQGGKPDLEGTTEKLGTQPFPVGTRRAAIVEYFNGKDGQPGVAPGVQAEMRPGTIDDIKRSVDDGNPVIVGYQPVPGVKHYSVVTGVDDQYVYMRDPYAGVYRFDGMRPVTDKDNAPVFDDQGNVKQAPVITKRGELEPGYRYIPIGQFERMREGGKTETGDIYFSGAPASQEPTKPIEPKVLTPSPWSEPTVRDEHLRKTDTREPIAAPTPSYAETVEPLVAPDQRPMGTEKEQQAAPTEDPSF